MEVISRKTILRQLLSEYRVRKDRAEAEADRVRLRIAEEVPVYADLNGVISRMLVQASSAALNDPANAKEIAAHAQQQVLELRKQAEGALRAAGHTVQELEPKYGCPICKDTGFVGSPIHEYCSCIKVELLRRMYDDAGIGEETFEHFDLNVFSDVLEEGEKETQRQCMRRYREYCEKYANRFPEVNLRNLVLRGRTGLGKTYLMNCIAARLLDRGIPVLRVTAYRMLDAMRRYHRGQDEDELNQMMQAEVLIIDDLGTEPMLENVTLEYLFTLLNERRVNKRATLVATNLTMQELKNRYAERIFSRLSDRADTNVLNFIGKDVRLRK